VKGPLAPIAHQVKTRPPQHTNGDPYTSPATLPVLLCISGRWPLLFNFASHCAATRQLLLPTLSDWLSVPQASWTQNLNVRIGFGLINFPPKFAKVYRAGWDAKMRELMQRDVEASVALALGERKGYFSPQARLPFGLIFHLLR
jgi:hypothetical protein